MCDRTAVDANLSALLAAQQISHSLSMNELRHGVMNAQDRFDRLLEDYLSLNTSAEALVSLTQELSEALTDSQRAEEASFGRYRQLEAENSNLSHQLSDACTQQLHWQSLATNASHDRAIATTSARQSKNILAVTMVVSAAMILFDAKLAVVRLCQHVVRYFQLKGP